jgi:Type II CAAX prenyl endopeptidase Rce1-like
MSMGLGLLVGLGALAVIRLVIEPVIPAAGARIAAAAALPLWRRVAIIYVAAVGEELVFRLLLLSLIAGIAARLVRRTERVPGRRIIWFANGLSALAFAAVHLPAWSAIGPLSLGLALTVLMLNGLGGLVFGDVFVKHGISAAIWAHAGADCAVQLIGPLTG